MKTIRVGNDISVSWSIFSRNGSPYVIDSTSIKLWLMSGPFKKQISDFIVAENVIYFTVDAHWVHRLGVYKLILLIKNNEFDPANTAYDFTEVFQIVSKTYPGPEASVLDGDVSLSLRAILDNVIMESVVNNPDEEDLTAEDNLLKFRDRPAAHGMLGRKILRKDQSLASQMEDENTIYEVRYEFDLDGETVAIPSGCVLDFNGGKFSDGTLVGNHTTFNTDVAYKIFDNVEFSGFDIPFIDIRWLGAVPDFDESSQTGTNNSPYLEEAITLAGKYYAGTGIRIVGRYMLSTAITTEYDVNIFGYHNNSRRLLVSQPNPSSPSLLFIGANITAITMAGQGEQSKSSNISLHNLKVWGPSTSTFINYTCSGAPGRVSIIEECEFKALGCCLKLTNTGRNTMLGNLTIDKCNVWYCSQFVVAASTGNNHTFCNLIIQNSNIEQGGNNQIELVNAFGPIIITNNIIEGFEGNDFLRMSASYGAITITNNYFEHIWGYLFHITQRNSYGLVDLNNNFYDNNSEPGADPTNHIRDYKAKMFISNATVQNLDFSAVWTESTFQYCTFKNTCQNWANFKLTWIDLNCNFDFIPIFSGGYNLSDNKTVSKTIGSMLATTCGTSYQTYVEKNYTDMPESADCFVFATDGATLDIKLMVSGSGSGIQQKIRTNKDGFCIFRYLPFATGLSVLQIKADGNSECAVGPVQILTPDKSLRDVKIPTIESTISVTTGNRPTFSKEKGYTIFDSTLGKLIVWNGTAWVNADGTSLA